MTVENLQWPDPPLADGVIMLDRLLPDDLDDVVLASDATAQRWLPLPNPYTRADAEEFLLRGEESRRAGQRMHLVIRPAEGGRLLGTVSLQLEGKDWEGAIGYAIAPWARGRGLAARASILIARHGLHVLGLRRVEILVRPDNATSRAVARATGAVYEGIRRDGILFHVTDQSFDAAVYALVRGDL